MCDRLCIGLLEEGEDAGGSLVRGRVEEGHDVLCAVLKRISA
jgi:hypothetical protein